MCSCFCLLSIYSCLSLSLPLSVVLCAVVVETTSNCPPNIAWSHIVLPAIYLYSFPPIVRLFYLTRCLHPYLLLASIQPGVMVIRTRLTTRLSFS